MMRSLLIFLCLIAAPLRAEPAAFILDAARSEVTFTYDFQGNPRTGTMPVKSAEILLDLTNVPASAVTVTLDPASARAGFIFATQVMRGPEVLDTATHPTITFRSISLEGDLRGATVSGELTVRGVTRPVTLEAGLYRQAGTRADDLDNLAVLLTGSIDRNDYGASGFPGYVGPEIGLRVLAVISRAAP